MAQHEFIKNCIQQMCAPAGYGLRQFGKRYALNFFFILADNHSSMILVGFCLTG